eukprot:CAMPEP_0114502368 /NCGR_PEP_ID=MMETSP0109-20121206/9049_1 /TAXON_ID=29199 /ORGANISM="Chlorarachnion reptans, Strain CCCM449" /LENGTH=148 /DNA_ID=CAMNT_0001680269 /DNA_START=78 /DNA_END=524 /DNA_ORIENTATION=+
MKSVALLISVFLNISLVVVLCVFAVRGSGDLGAAPVMSRTASTVGIGRPITQMSRSYLPRVHAEPGKQMNFKDLPKMAFGGVATAKALGLAGVARAAEVQQMTEIAGYQAGDGQYVLGVAGNIFACSVLGVILGFAMLRLEQVLTAKE